MGRVNIIEKGLAKKAQLDTVMPGERITVTPDILMLSGDSILSIIEEFYELGYGIVHCATSTFIIQDSFNISEEIALFSAKHGVNLLKQNVGFITEQDPLTDKIITGIERREIGEFGAFGSIALHVSPATMAKCLGTGKIELTVPETIYIEMNGLLSGNQKVEGICAYLNDYFNDSLVGYGIILGGESLNHLDDEAKRRLTTFLYELGGAIAMISPSGPLGQVESAVKIKTHQITDRNRV